VTSNIGSLNEKPLHAALKAWYAEPSDRLEVPVEGFIVDIVRGDLLIEIQTRGFASLKRKLLQLTAHHPLRLVHPIAREKWIVRLEKGGAGQLGRRKSPKRGTIEQLFQELVSFPKLIAQPNFSIDVLLIQEEEIRRQGERRSWRRRGWTTQERRLLQVVGRRRFETPTDLGDLIPPDLVEPFTTSDLARAIAQPRRLAQRMAYCLRELGIIAPDGKQGNAVLYVRAT
jgi:hypothetical protein